MLLACLDFKDTNRGPFKFRGLSEIAGKVGHQVESVSYDGSSEGFIKACDKAAGLIEQSSAFFLPNSRIFSIEDLDHAAHARRIRRRIKDGARLLVTPFINKLDNWNAFLAPYDLLVTTLRIYRREGKTLFGRDGEITIARSAHSFRDAHLFRGVHQVVLRQPVAIWYGGESLPLLMATETELPIDATTDFLPVPEPPSDPQIRFPPEWNARELACMAVWYGEKGGAVLASVGPVLSDPFIDQNQVLAANIIAFLAENSKPPMSAVDICHNIEICLVDFVLGVLRSTGDNWWTERIQFQIREKCAVRHEEEKCHYPKEAYLDLIDLKTIINKEWVMFESHLRAVGCEGGKEKSLAWLDRLNEIRRMVGHPLKKHVAGYNFSKEEMRFLTECNDLVVKLRKRIKPSG